MEKEDKWRYVKTAVKCGLFGALLLWTFGLGYNFVVNFVLTGSAGFLGQFLEERNPDAE